MAPQKVCLVISWRRTNSERVQCWLSTRFQSTWLAVLAFQQLLDVCSSALSIAPVWPFSNTLNSLVSTSNSVASVLLSHQQLTLFFFLLYRVCDNTSGLPRHSANTVASLPVLFVSGSRLGPLSSLRVPQMPLGGDRPGDLGMLPDGAACERHRQE